MADIPVYVPDDLAAHIGIPLERLELPAAISLEEATFFVKVITGLKEMPTDPTLAKLVEKAILEVAFKLYLERLSFEAVASPYQSETIGSYSYSVKNASSTSEILNGTRPTGLRWLDLLLKALAELNGNKPSATAGAGGSVSLFENDNVEEVNGRRKYIGPVDYQEYGYGPYFPTRYRHDPNQ